MNDAQTSLQSLHKKHIMWLSEKIQPLEIFKNELKQHQQKSFSSRHEAGLKSLAHQIINSTSVYSSADITEAARQLNLACDASEQLTDEQQAQHRDTLLTLTETLIHSLKKPCDPNSKQQTEATPNLAVSVVAHASAQAHKISKILLTGDDPSQRSFLETTLKHNGYQVYPIDHVEQASAALKKFQPDLFIIDIIASNDPNADLDTVKSLKNSGELSCPLVFITTEHDFMSKLNTIRSKGDAFITKPVDTVELTHCIERLNIVHHPESHPVLILEDETAIANFYEFISQNAGIHLLQPTNSVYGLTLADSELKQPAELAPTLIEDNIFPAVNTKAAVQAKRILVVEDHRTNQLLIERQLTHLGFDLSIAKDGEQGLQMWRNERFDLIMTDCLMPVMDGYEMTRAIRLEESLSGSRIPIIAITANAMPSDVKKCLTVGMSAVITKPTSIAKLSEVLDKWYLPCDAQQIGTAQLQPDKQNINKQDINFSVISTYIGEDIAAHKELISAFLDSASSSIETLITAIETLSWDDIIQESHKLKSTSKSVGAIKLAEHILHIERAGKEKNIDSAMQQSQPIRKLLSEYVKAFKEHFDEKEKPAEHTAVVNNTYFNNLKLCLIDDDEIVLKHLSSLLKSFGITQVQQEKSAQSALTRLDNAHLNVDIMVIDINMPDVDGIALLRHLAERQFSGGIILLSGEDKKILKTVASLVENHQLNLVAALEKPVQAKELKSALNNFKCLSDSPKVNATSHEVTAKDLLLALNNKEIVPHFQPQVNAKTGKLVGVEALARWFSPEFGFVSPSRFIPLAEEHGLIKKLTESIYLQSLRQVARWKKLGLQTRVSVNFSMKSLDDVELTEELQYIAEECGLTPSQVIIELTESALEGNTPVTMEILSRLRLYGFGLSIDDFGTGYATLKQLQRLPFGEMKLDLGYVSKATKEQEAKAILEASILLAKRLGLETVAEGVEDEETLNLLLELGADVIQGYYISKPMKGSELLTWYARWRKDNSFNSPATGSP